MRKFVLLLTTIIIATGILSFTSERQVEGKVKVICFNIRYDNEGDGVNAWSKRKEAVVKMLQVEKPQIIGMQEVLKGQLDYLHGNLKGYASIGVGRDDGKEAGEYSPILYNTKVLKVVKSGYFWLSETSDTPSLGWDAACKRIATWGVFEDKNSKKKFICINTHFDHVGKKAREMSGNQMLDSVKKLAAGLPAMIMGDFNAEITDPSLAPLLTQTKNVRAAKPEFSKQPEYSFIGFANKEQDRSLIDHIFINNFKVEDYRIILDKYGVNQLSDHLPVMCELKY